MSLNRPTLLNDESLSFKEKIQLILERCEERVEIFEKLMSDKQHIYMITVKAIQHYLVAYLKKDASDDFTTILLDGYKKYDEYAASDYIPTLELCKADALNSNDLDCAMRILQQSAFLANDDFLEKALRITNKFAITQFAKDNNDPSVIEEFSQEFLSNGFKYYLEGILEEQRYQWCATFANPTALTTVNIGFNIASFLSLALGSGLLFNDHILSGISCVMSAVAISKAENSIFSDKLTLTIFAKSKQEANAEKILTNTPKQHITPYHI